MSQSLNHLEVQKNFQDLCDHLFSELKSTEKLSVNLHGEQSLFLRFNQNHIRQSTAVDQLQVSLSLQSGGKTCDITALMTSNFEDNKTVFINALNRLRQEIPDLETSPYLVEFQNNGVSSEIFNNTLPVTQEVIESLWSQQSCSKTELDLAGLYCAGPIYRASKNNLGQSHWYSANQFFLDFSLYTQNLEGDNKAVKSLYSSQNWSAQELQDSIAKAKDQLEVLKRPNKTVTPGKYKVYLAPGAASDLLGMLGWNAMSYSAYKKGMSAFAQLADNKRKLSPLFSVSENFELGLCPKFNSLGELSADKVPLIQNGELISFLVSSRAEKEYGVKTNGADNSGFSGMESLRSPDFATGSLDEKLALKELGTGLYLNNLHYLNWSEVSSARITGMTRYACFWVENGEIVAPIQDLRFDESLFHALGDGLIAVSNRSQIEPNTMTYGMRSTGGRQNPGLMIDSFTFTL